MLNKLHSFISRYGMLRPGDHVICAVSGGADSVALLLALHMLKDKLGITISAAHFNHQLRGDESNRDEAFVRSVCENYHIALDVGTGKVVAGEKGLEAAARDARYAYFDTLSGKLATAHNANDNAETVLMHMLRGTALRGLGGIAPVNGRVIRPMLNVTRGQILDFLRQHDQPFVQDSSNDTDAFLRNRIRRHVMPILEQENPRAAETMSEMALQLRQDELFLSRHAAQCKTVDVGILRELASPIRSRVIVAFLRENGLSEPEAEHIRLVERLVFSEKPSARAHLKRGLIVERQYGVLRCRRDLKPLSAVEIPRNGIVEFQEQRVRVCCADAMAICDTQDRFTVIPCGKMMIRSRQPGDSMRLPGGTKELKRIFIDRKIPASERGQIPVVVDETGIIGVYGIGANRDRIAFGEHAVEIRFERI